MAADQDERIGAGLPDAASASASTSSVSSACMQAMPTSAGRVVRKQAIERSAVAQIGDGRAMPAHLERRGDVLEPERLDPEERPEAEAIVARHRAQQQDVHTRSPGGYHPLSGRSSDRRRQSVESVLIFARRHARVRVRRSRSRWPLWLSSSCRASRSMRTSFGCCRSGSPSVRDFQLFLQNFGSLDHLYVVFETADAIGDHGELVDRYVEALRQAPEIESVDAQLFEPGKDWSYLSDRELYLLGADGAAAALARFRSPQLDREVAHARDLLSMPSPQIKALVQQDPLGLLTMLRDRMGREKGFVSFDPTQEGYVSQDGRSRLVVVKPKGPPFDTDFCKALFRAVGRPSKRAARNEVASPDRRGRSGRPSRRPARIASRSKRSS